MKFRNFALMKMTLKNRIARSQEVLQNGDVENCMHRNDIEVVFHASAMVGSQLDRHYNKILMNRNAVPKRWDSDSNLSDHSINSAFKKAYEQVVEYLEQEYNITPGRILKLLDILTRAKREYSRVRKELTHNEHFNRYLRQLNDLRMHYKEMTDPEIYDFSFDMMYDFIDVTSLREATLSLSFLIMYWIQRENKLLPLALSYDKDTFLTALDTQSEDILAMKEVKKNFRLLMRKSLDLHLKEFIKSQDSNKKSTSRDRILELIKSHPKHTAKTMASCLGLSVQAIQKQIAILKAENRLQRIGPDNGGYWMVLKPSLDKN